MRHERDLNVTFYCRDMPILRALDLGTGSGSYLLELYDRDYSPTGVDMYYSASREVIEEVKRGGIKYVVSKAEKFVGEEPPRTYELVSIQRPDALLRFIVVSVGRKNPKETNRFLRNIHRILKRNGRPEILFRLVDCIPDDVRRTLGNTDLFYLDRERNLDCGLYEMIYISK